MTIHPPNDRLTAFLIELECLHIASQKALMFAEMVQFGGVYMRPICTDNCSRKLFEIALHGVVAYGASEVEAIRNWTKAAKAVAPLVDDDGFITVYQSPTFSNPRNHAEEIANAQAAAGQGAA